MMRAAIYARYSSDLPSAASIEDQVRLCRERLECEGWKLVGTYTDRAISGASHLRAGYQQLLQDARAGKFDVVVAEALDRISRDQEHVAGFYKQLGFCGVKVVTLSEGEITELHVGLKGTMNALFLKDLANKTRRGLRGRVETGHSGGGLSYGYQVVRELDAAYQPINGQRRIDEAQANVVRHIYADFIAGKSPRAIAKTLNADHVPGPSGKAWTASTIHGNRQRGTGILNNELYIGKLVWNRLRYSKDPATGKRVSRLNPKSQWIITDVPELQIVDDRVWQAVKERQATLALTERSEAIRNALNARHRARYLLSGLLTCGVCGAGYTLVGSDRYACADHVNRGTCSNKRTVARKAIERRVLTGIKDKLLSPDLIQLFISEFTADWNARLATERRGKATIEAEVSEVERRLGQIMAAIEQGIITPTTKARLLELEERRERLKVDLARSATAVAPPALHPGLADVYRRKVAELEMVLDNPAWRTEAALVLRGLVDRVVLRPGEKRGEVRAELHGVLACLLSLEQEKTRPSSDVRVSLVAGIGFEPMTFRL
jgi:site-specific DNA recombinase